MRFRFNDTEIDTASMELVAAGAVTPTEPQVFDLVRYLIENRDRVVSRDDLIEGVWRGRIVSDSTISARINAARRAVGDTGQVQAVIRTVPRRGYRFVASVEVAAPKASYRGIEIPANDAERVAALRSYDILDTDPEPEFDAITAVAAQLSECRYAYISFCDETRFWLKSKVGYPEGFTERPRELSMCPATLLASDLLIIEDMRRHPRYRHLPSVVNPPHARFYCAMPLIDPEGFALGTLCVWDPGARRLDEGQRQAIRTLSGLTLRLLEMRRSIRALEAREEKLVALAADLRALLRP